MVAIATLIDLCEWLLAEYWTVRDMDIVFKFVPVGVPIDDLVASRMLQTL
jgi:hypothetical protein